MVVAPKKDDVVNMILVVTIRNQIPKNVVFKEKKPLKNKSLVDSQEEKKLQCSFEEAIKDIQQKEPLGASIQTLNKANFTKNFGLDIENQFIRPIKFTKPTNFIDSTGSINVIGFTDSTRNTGIIRFIKNIGPTEKKKVWRISSSNYWRVNMSLFWTNSSRSLQI